MKLNKLCLHCFYRKYKAIFTTVFQHLQCDFGYRKNVEPTSEIPNECTDCVKW
jgi:hypothetical protein